MTIKTIKEANDIIGGLSKPSKMPGHTYNLPASACKVGSALRKVEGSVCANCYACKGRYVFGTTQKALQRRLESIGQERWVEAMAFAINKRAAKEPYFRWHDSGDIQSWDHLMDIFKVAKLTPTVRHWIPTKEYKLAARAEQEGLIPGNVTLRVSMPLVGQQPSDVWSCTSTVGSGFGVKCPVKSGTESCDTYRCRACWDGNIYNVDYKKH